MLVKGTGTSGTSDLLKTITACSVILHACSQLKFYPDVSELAEHVKGGVFHPLTDIFQMLLVIGELKRSFVLNLPTRSDIDGKRKLTGKGDVTLILTLT